MGKCQSVTTFLLCIMVLLFCGRLVGAMEEKPASLEQQVEGLWLYTGLTTSAGKDLPLTGIFLFKDGIFVQYAEFKGEPAKDQGAMTHAGPYSIRDGFVHLVAEQTISTQPLENPPLRSQGLTEHDVAVKRSGKELTLIFSKGTGTVQNFEHVGTGSGEVYKLKNGALALVDGYFILVDGNESGVDAGYGTYEKENNTIKLKVKRWTKADQAAASNIRDTSINATFDGQSLTLEDGRSFQVIP